MVGEGGRRCRTWRWGAADRERGEEARQCGAQRTRASSRGMAAIDVDVSVPQLRCFLAVVDGGSVAEAGRRLGMSAASVSKAITRLEDGAGVRLLHRSTHAISLTDAGEALLEPAREAARAAEAFAETASHASNGSDGGIVRLTAAPGMVRHVIAPLVGELARVHPDTDIRVDIRVTNRVLDLAEGGIDLAIRSGPFDGLPGHIAQTWFAAPWVLCATPGYLAGRAPRVPARSRRARPHRLPERQRARLALAAPGRQLRAEGPLHLRRRRREPQRDARRRRHRLHAALSRRGLPPERRLGRGARTAPRRAHPDLAAPPRAAPDPGRLTKLIAFLNARAPDLSDLL
ncbi:hypothetical protein BE21_55170 [Sorangium cellulosum]|uniref:HTH lysR-type domain-containing protein n=1 Tax=Sorangium cellulosum TaxID=56 RepID=A0A150TC46_SORCE|nr:hypothetical protein BE21_55170 [Sorangium cellulosum]